MTGLESLLDRFDDLSRPGDPAFVDADGRVRLRRGELGARIRAIAGAYARVGLGPGARVAFGVRQDATGIPWLLGALRAGIVPVVMDPGISPDHLVDRVRTAGVEAIVADGMVTTLLRRPILRALAARRGVALPDPARIEVPTFATSFALARVPRLDRLTGGDARRPLGGHEPAVILFTSGSTGAPRGVVYGGDGLVELMTSASRIVPLGPGSVVLGTGLHLVVPAVLAGATVVLGPSPSPAGLAELVRRRGITHLSLAPHAALAFARAGGSARFLLLGSAPIRNTTLAELVRRMPCTEILSVYGMTEYLLIAAVDAAERLVHDEAAGDLVGRPFDRVRVRIAPDGEVHVGGPAAALGYLDGVLGVDEVPTGDLGRIDDAGRLVLIGRRKEMLIRGGQNIYPALYETRLADAADLEAVVMVGIPDDHADETVVLFGVPRRPGDAKVVVPRLRQLLASPWAPIDRHAMPDAVFELAALPRAGRSGKIDRRALVRIAAERLGRYLAEDASLPEPPS